MRLNRTYLASPAIVEITVKAKHAESNADARMYDRIRESDNKMMTRAIAKLVKQLEDIR